MSFRIFLKYKYTQKYKDFTGLSKIIIFADPDGTTFMKVEQDYLDSLSNEKVWFGNWTLKQCREMEISLGLD